MWTGTALCVVDRAGRGLGPHQANEGIDSPLRDFRTTRRVDGKGTTGDGPCGIKLSLLSQLSAASQAHAHQTELFSEIVINGEHSEFSPALWRNATRAMRTAKASTSDEIGGRPGYCRCLKPSNFWASSLRYQARIVSGLATHATSRSALRPRRFPISARVIRSGSERRSRAGNLVLKIRFSAAKSHSATRVLG
jgi:hypothetical protein